MPFFQQLQEATETARTQFLNLPVLQAGITGQVDKALYISFLSQAYHHVKHTVPLLMACGSHLNMRLNWLRAAIAEYINEEIGHEEWILNDLAACGVDKAQIRASQPSLATEIMVAYAYDLIQRRNPVGFFGMVYVLEGTSVALAQRGAQAIQHSLQLPDTAFSYLTSHGALDIEHMAHFERLMNRLENAEDQMAVSQAAIAFYHLYGNIFSSLPHNIPSEAGRNAA